MVAVVQQTWAVVKRVQRLFVPQHVLFLPAGATSSSVARDEIRAELVKLGVDPAEADARVQALSDQEAALAVERMPQLPAGGDGGLIGAIVFIFLVLLLTDLLGLTNVYPFVKKHR